MALQAGTIQLTVEFAKGLSDKDWFGKQDPYVIVALGSQKVRSRTHIDGGKNPVWNETFNFQVINDNTIYLAIYDEDTLSNDDLIGTTNISLAKVREQGRDRIQAPIITTHNKQRGFVSLSLVFTANNALKKPEAVPQYPGAQPYAQQAPGYPPQGPAYPQPGYPPQPQPYPSAHYPQQPYPSGQYPAPQPYPQYAPQQQQPAGQYPPPQQQPAGQYAPQQAPPPVSVSVHYAPPPYPQAASQQYPPPGQYPPQAYPGQAPQPYNQSPYPPYGGQR